MHISRGILRQEHSSVSPSLKRTSIVSIIRHRIFAGGTVLEETTEEKKKVEAFSKRYVKTDSSAHPGLENYTIEHCKASHMSGLAEQLTFVTLALHEMN
jgi:hypothetical protein